MSVQVAPFDELPALVPILQHCGFFFVACGLSVSPQLSVLALAEAPIDVLLHFSMGLPTRGQGSGGVAHLVPQITPLVANSNDMLSRFAFPVDRDVFSFRVKTKLADPVLGERLR